MSLEVKRIARILYLAQSASDGGKGIYKLPNDSGVSHYQDSYRICYKKAYAAKDSLIIRAIDLINRSHDKTVRFSVRESTDQNGQKCYLVYFDFKVEGKREQVSFHSFNDELRKFVSNSKKSTWSKDRSSRDTVLLVSRKGISPR